MIEADLLGELEGRSLPGSPEMGFPGMPGGWRGQETPFWAFAAGNDMTGSMGGTYPGAGITIGPALTFGYIAARHAASAGR
jgi:hypothetical protein